MVIRITEKTRTTEKAGTEIKVNMKKNIDWNMKNEQVNNKKQRTIIQRIIIVL